MTGIDTLDKAIASKVAFILYEGEKEDHASTIINLSGKEVEVRKR